MIEETLIETLLADDDLTALVGTRIRFVERDQTDALPALTIQKVSALPGYTMAGPDGLSRDRFQIDVWATTYSSARQISRILTARLNTSSNDFQAFQRSERDGGEELNNARVFRVSLDFEIYRRK